MLLKLLSISHLPTLFPPRKTFFQQVSILLHLSSKLLKLEIYRVRKSAFYIVYEIPLLLVFSLAPPVWVIIML